MKNSKMIKHCISGVVLAGFVSQAAYAQNATSSRAEIIWTKDTATQNEIAEAKRHLSESLKDPYSAQYEEIWALKGTNGKRSICGYVNSKNSYGGYTGKKMFNILSSGSVVFEGSGILGSLLPSICMPRTVK